jgi:hypothetical protein
MNWKNKFCHNFCKGAKLSPNVIVVFVVFCSVRGFYPWLKCLVPIEQLVVAEEKQTPERGVIKIARGEAPGNKNRKNKFWRNFCREAKQKL